MIKKLIFVIIVLNLVFSCGKKGDPEYKESEIIKNEFVIIWCTTKIIIFLLKKLVHNQ